MKCGEVVKILNEININNTDLISQTGFQLLSLMSYQIKSQIH